MSSRDKGYVYQQRYTRDGKTHRTETWYIRYYVNGRRVTESTGKTDKDQAEEILADRLAEIRVGQWSDPKLRQITFDELADDLVAYAKKKGLKSLNAIEYRLDKHVRPFFGALRATDITPSTIDRYQVERLDDDAAAGTVNREVGLVRRALRLAHRRGKLEKLPYIEMLPERNVREGFVSQAQLAAIVAELEEHHRRWPELAFYTGWRKREILGLEWSNVTEDAIVLSASRSKNAEVRRFPLEGSVRDCVERQRAYVRGLQKKTGKVIPHMFPYPDGRPIRHPHRSWTAACERANLQGTLIHDLRRSFVKHMLDAGVDERTIMRLGGWKTRSAFERYNIRRPDAEKAAVRAIPNLTTVEPERKVHGVSTG